MPPTLGHVLDAAVTRLRDTSPTPRADVEALALHAFGLSRAALITSTHTIPPAAEMSAFRAMIDRRHTGEPVAYITGHREFWSLDLLVSPATLIPRPETELLVEQALVHIPTDVPSTVFDLGTGSGAVAFAIAHERRQARVIGTDRSHDALAIANANAGRLDLANVEFCLGDWFPPLAGIRADVIVSNPPYVRAGDPHVTTGDLRYEPRMALMAGQDGLAALRQLIAAAPGYLRPGGWLLLEHGTDQADDVAKVMHEYGFTEQACKQDLQGHARISLARYRP